MSPQPARLAQNRLPQGGLIDRTKPITFFFDGKRYQGHAGDTLASALLANGVHHVARSFKYHRPRGILGAGPEDPGALVRIGSDPATMVVNQRATEVELYDGLEAFPQNCWPSLRFDIGVVNDLMHRFLPAGFYYKTFMGPPGNWMVFEPFIRRAAGLGPAPSAPDPARYEHMNRHCEVLVIGSGPAGLAAAHEAARTGARVILAEESAACGGRILAEAEGNALIEGLAPRAWCAAVLDELAAHPEVTLLTRTSASGYYAQNWVTLFENCTDHLPSSETGDLPRHRLWRVRAQQVVLATGAIERPLVFNGNDRPGIMLASAARTYLHRYGVRPGENAVIFANNDDAWRSAFDLHDAGARIAAIIDARPDPAPAHHDAAQARGIPVRLGATILATRGRRRIRSVDIAAFDAGGVAGRPERIACDLLCVSGGWSPNVALFSQSGGSLRHDETLAAFVPDEARQAVVPVGACEGDFALSDAISSGAEAGRAAARKTGFVADATDHAAGETRDGTPPYRVTPVWELPSNRPKSRIRAFVDHQNDVTAKDLHLAVREGYGAVEHAKRYTTTGMGTDQGKTVGINAIGVLSGVLDKPIGEIGVTTYRPPWKPISFGAVAGQHVGALFHPRRTTPMHDWHVANGAVFEIVGDWLRARVYRQPGEDFAAALQRECRAARNAIGVLDASTLGKIDIRGKDARAFLNRIYSNAWMKLEPGRCRYGLMTNEDGMVFDDGVTACLGDDHFHMTTTTGGAARVLGWLEEYHQTEWPDLEVYMSSVTEQWAVASICGPRAPELAAGLFDDIDADPERFPFMSHASGHIDGVPARVFRISFTGEISYEINVPASYGLWLWRTLMERGGPYGITPYGTEGMHLLRAEKGFIIVGQETDGTLTPVDLGMGWAVKKNADFIGKRSLTRSDTARDDRLQLVGLLSDDPAFVIPEGSQIIASAREQSPRTPMIGHVTSSYFSPNLGRAIALAVVAGGHGRMGERIHIARAGAEPVPATITGTDFLAGLKDAS